MVRYIGRSADQIGGSGVIIPSFAEFGTVSSATQISTQSQDASGIRLYTLDSNGHIITYANQTLSSQIYYRGVVFDANDNPTFNAQTSLLAVNAGPGHPFIAKNGNYYGLNYDFKTAGPANTHDMIMKKYTGWDGTTLIGGSTLATYGPTTNSAGGGGNVAANLFHIPWESTTFLFTPTQGASPVGIEMKVFDASSDTVVSTATSQSRTTSGSTSAWAIGLNETLQEGMLVLNVEGTFPSFYYLQPFTISSGTLSFGSSSQRYFNHPTTAGDWQTKGNSSPEEIQPGGGLQGNQDNISAGCIPFGRGFVYFFSTGYAWCYKKLDGTWIYSPWYWYGHNTDVAMTRAGGVNTQSIKLSENHCIHRSTGMSEYWSFYVNFDDEDNLIVLHKPLNNTAMDGGDWYAPHTNKPKKLIEFQDDVTAGTSSDYRTIPVTYTSDLLDSWYN